MYVPAASFLFQGRVGWGGGPLQAAAFVPQPD